MFRRFFTIIALILIGLAVFWRLTNPIAYNFLLSLSGVSGNSPESLSALWYGLGQNQLGEQDEIALVEKTLIHPSHDLCSDREINTLRLYASLPFQFNYNDHFRRIDLLLRARQAVCEGYSSEALKLISSKNDAEWAVQRIEVFNSLDKNEEALSLAIDVVCGIHEDWCDWCMRQMVVKNGVQGNKLQTDDVLLLTNDDDGRFRNGELTIMEDLYATSSPGVTFSRKTPMVVKNALNRAAGDNYIEFSAQPASGSAVRYQLSGVVLGPVSESCIYPRIVFQGGNGEYISEYLPRFSVSGKFQIELWLDNPEGTSKIIPRATFDPNCFSGGQEIAICSADLATRQ